MFPLINKRENGVNLRRMNKDIYPPFEMGAEVKP